jgi:hypothetical protein
MKVFWVGDHVKSAPCFDVANRADRICLELFLLAKWGEEYNGRLRFEMLYFGEFS